MIIRKPLRHRFSHTVEIVSWVQNGTKPPYFLFLLSSHKGEGCLQSHFYLIQPASFRGYCPVPHFMLICNRKKISFELSNHVQMMVKSLCLAGTRTGNWDFQRVKISPFLGTWWACLRSPRSRVAGTIHSPFVTEELFLHGDRMPLGSWEIPLSRDSQTDQLSYHSRYMPCWNEGIWSVMVCH